MRSVGWRCLQVRQSDRRRSQYPEQRGLRPRLMLERVRIDVSETLSLSGHATANHQTSMLVVAVAGESDEQLAARLQSSFDAEAARHFSESAESPPPSPSRPADLSHRRTQSTGIRDALCPLSSR